MQPPRALAPAASTHLVQWRSSGSSPAASRPPRAAAMPPRAASSSNTVSTTSARRVASAASSASLQRHRRRGTWLVGDAGMCDIGGVCSYAHHVARTQGAQGRMRGLNPLCRPPLHTKTLQAPTHDQLTSTSRPFPALLQRPPVGHAPPCAPHLYLNRRSSLS